MRLNTDRTCAPNRFLKPETPVAKVLPDDFSAGEMLKRVGVLGTIHLNCPLQRINELRLDAFVIEIRCSSLAR